MSKIMMIVSVALAVVCSAIAYHVGKTDRRTTHTGSSSEEQPMQLQARLQNVERALRVCESNSTRRPPASEHGGKSQVAPSPSSSQTNTKLKRPLPPADRRFELAGTNLKVLRSYGPLLRRLELPANDERALIELLGTVLESRDPAQRSQAEAKIAAVLDAKGQQALREYERTIPARRSLDRVDYDLQSLGIPLSQEQREFVISSIVEVQAAMQMPDISSNTIESFESFLEYMDGSDHRVLEQSQSVLSAEQTKYFQYYFEAESAARHQSLERTKQRRAQGFPNEPFRWRPPGSI